MIRANSFSQGDISPSEVRDGRDQLQAGLKVTKFSANRKMSPKFIYLDTAGLKLTYTPSKKPVAATTIYVKDIEELREVEVKRAVPDTAVFKRCQSIIPEGKKENCCAIVFSAKYHLHRSLNIMFETLAEKNMFHSVITFLVASSRRAVTKDPETMRLVELWMKADRDNDRKLSREEVTLLLQKLNVQLNRSALKEMFRLADTDNSNFLNFEEFKSFYQLLHKRDEVEKIFKETSVDGRVDKKCLVSFLRNLQEERKEFVTEKRVSEILCEFGDPIRGLNLAQFTTYLFSKQNSWWMPHEREQVTQDMNSKLSHYFISSSHNTYLTGHQLHSRSAVDMYKIVLERGCRCVELDCWDGADGEPEIYHGYTRTTKIKFRAVCETIAKYAFKTSIYPVILSLEIHTSEKQQTSMANIMKEAFGSLLLPRQHTLPFTPNGLKHKILVKGKMASQHFVKRDEEDSEDEKEEPTEVKRQPKAKTPIALALSDVISIRATKVKDWGLYSQANEIQSYSEGASLQLLATDPARFAEMNKRMLSRTYPNGTRIASENYDPFPLWSVGVQCVALNHQTMDQHMRLNSAKFEANGGCGFLLKPRHLTEPGDSIEYQHCLKLVVTVISGCQIPKTGGRGEVVNPYVTVQINGTKDDTSDTQKTHTVRNNGFSPVWNKTFKFAIRCLPLAMLSLRVIDSSVVDDKIAEACIPVMHLMRGYRCVPLRSSTKDLTELENACLFCNFSVSVA